eukprot:CAMPEP_0184704308 /NCGR_PEP_ID=MMETSP0313-20130426/30746_1 /TAXON_ID=2792 /ORGANISM="Porphyridium aerugineum, Strain SAG 1380-2" /LENGTH=274 /DNA_ID=CAMNT_0027165323 /DNA_START=504 /DNA_END=1328 /DNA_ORIENTATION=-
MVDVVLEIRDCRIPMATTHPMVTDWVGSKYRVVVMNRSDMVTASARSAWKTEYKVNAPHGAIAVCFVNAQTGNGVPMLKKLILSLSGAVNEKRVKKGMLPRPIRCAVIGYPNVGKSALINRLVNKRAVKSENRPGVTRSLHWVRISSDLELLDSPGIIPMKLVEQETALKLAYCNDIGEASYDSELVAAALLEDMRIVSDLTFKSFCDFDKVLQRYRMTLDSANFIPGDELLHQISALNYKGETGRTANTVLLDFRSGKFGGITLEVPPSYEKK